MKKTPYLESKRHKFWKYVLVWAIILLILCLMGCAKTATETAADAALQQVAVVEQQIKKECPEAKIDKSMDALRSSIHSQLATCELQRAKVESDKVKWQVAFFSMLIIVGIWFGKKFI